MKEIGNKYYLTMLACCFFLFNGQALHAHASDMDLSRLSETDTAILYLKLGFQHILPLGADHILFVVGIFLFSSELKPIILQVTAFTIAHCITLVLAMLRIISLPVQITEPIIALSIFFVAAENILNNKLKTSRIILVFLFGLIHGLGFAGVLTEIGLPKHAFFQMLLLFNIGVELGQLTIIILLWLLIGKWFSKKNWYRKRVVIPISISIAIIALHWTIQRIFFIPV